MGRHPLTGTHGSTLLRKDGDTQYSRSKRTAQKNKLWPQGTYTTTMGTGGQTSYATREPRSSHHHKQRSTWLYRHGTRQHYSQLSRPQKRGNPRDNGHGKPADWPTKQEARRHLVSPTESTNTNGITGYAGTFAQGACGHAHREARTARQPQHTSWLLHTGRVSWGITLSCRHPQVSNTTPRPSLRVRFVHDTRNEGHKA